MTFKVDKNIAPPAAGSKYPELKPGESIFTVVFWIFMAVITTTLVIYGLVVWLPLSSIGLAYREDECGGDDCIECKKEDAKKICDINLREVEAEHRTLPAFLRRQAD